MADPNDPQAADKRELIMPTPVNVLNAVHRNIVNNLRRGRSSDLDLPSLYRLAFAVHYNTGEMVLTLGDSEEQ
jgi:hypothetical protein